MSKVTMTEEASTSLIHKTIRSLINLSQNENIETEIRLLANECLGYFGPLNLKTMTLYFDEITDSKEALIRLLLEYVTNSDAKVSEAAIYGLKRVLCSNIDKGSIPEVLESYLQPFQNSFQQSKEKPNCDVLLKVEDLNEAIRKIEWWPKSDHNTWIKNLVCTLLEAYPKVKTGFLSKTSMIGHHLLPMASKKAKFCDQILPWIIHDILKSIPTCDSISWSILEFFEKFHRLKTIKDKKCLVSMLQVIKYLRRQSKAKNSNKWEDNFWIKNCNYLHIGKSIFLVQNFTTRWRPC